MAVATVKVIEALSQLSEQENLCITVTESAKGALIVGGFAFVGGLVGGPVGLGIGMLIYLYTWWLVLSHDNCYICICNVNL